MLSASARIPTVQFSTGERLLSRWPRTGGLGHLRTFERREVLVSDDRSQGTADIGKGRLAEAGSPKQPFVETSR